jgi:calcineurin-like phosphoesterase family protein
LPNGDVPEKQTRPFETLDKMNASIVNNINEVVGQDDVLIHFGDWAFSGFDKIQEFHDRLICKNIHLILGNHDHYIDSNKNNIRNLFLSVSWFEQLNYMGETIEMCHYPISSWNGLKKGRIMLHGHCHLPNEKKISNGRRMDVGMDGHLEFRPYNLLKEIMNPMKKIPIGSELGSDDHHLDDMQGVVG